MLFGKNVLDIARKRRSIYHLKNKISVSDDKLITMIEDSIRLAPTPFNNQSVRAVILLGKYHARFWELLNHAARNIFSIQNYKQNHQGKIISFSRGYGTILFFTDTSVVNSFAKDISMFKRRSFVNWSEQAQGSAQFLVWVALAEKNIGASIHHYDAALNNSINTRHLKINDHVLQRNIKKRFKLPDSWDLRTEMVFGGIGAPARNKSMIPNSKRFKVFK